MNSQPIMQGDEMHKLLPQRPPIVMVDKFYGVDDNISCTGLLVNETNIFCGNGHLHESGIVEHIAQSAAARVGFIFTQKNEPVPLGFIGSVDKLTINFLPKVGSELYTTITVMQEVMDITLVAAKVETEGKIVAECKMKIFLKRD